ncbi:5,6-dimethylbenzimidazole synthase [Planctomycetes bacterium Pan216]|uniref:5,6-dimethylbenzimidazole synthase n=1 Tax=Kolteria novifilia TaxID=2527975 RepID=A0A518B0S0_9BACT|nr:5,6-dimethylbenzimidazole synthase [Planctomycetes bacterium Pan216]
METQDNLEFDETDREAIYRVMRQRRDVRRFRSNPIAREVLGRILEAAHYAPSVGYMQPWNFIIVTSREIREQIKEQYLRVNAEQADKLDDEERKTLYENLKLEGILESPLNIAVTCDHRRDAPFVLGRGPMPQTDLYSTCLAIQNLWLAARAEGVGVGWVSILDQEATQDLLHLPDGVELVAYLCVGYPVEFLARPMLEQVGWKDRMALKSLVFHDHWGEELPADTSFPPE